MSSTHYFLILVFAITFIALINTLKKHKYYEYSTGDYSSRERNTYFANQISPQQFDKQARNYTQEAVDNLLKSQDYQQNKHRLKRHRAGTNCFSTYDIANQSQMNGRDGYLGSKSFDATNQSREHNFSKMY
ncbi:UNKNOWN [Stylonychia lemnae]|uniref:Uncharacterized protein n=1 Tax=Stylonychia lemnae TaxID=5949 RepID=A0A078AC66_STYLE|nr:UNKNOWN [Stylonychia lemnae]|eukprot:CDW79431.1 UNKNOWN [Stylonychia lemnae]